MLAGTSVRTGDSPGGPSLRIEFFRLTRSVAGTRDDL
jgi:hypothetical protein